MSDLIDRQAVINTVKKHYRVDNDLLEVIVYQLENLPTAQPENCEGCKHLGKLEDELYYGVYCPCINCKRRVNDNYE